MAVEGPAPRSGDERACGDARALGEAEAEGAGTCAPGHRSPSPDGDLLPGGGPGPTRTRTCFPPLASAPANDADRDPAVALILGDDADANPYTGAFALSVPHGCDQSTAPARAFSRILWDSVIFAGKDDGEMSFRTYPVPGSRAALRAHPPGRLVVPAVRAMRGRDPLRRQKFVSECFLAFMKKHPGVVVCITGIGARDPVEWPERALRPVPGLPRLTAATHNYANAALVNAVHAIGGAGAADAVQRLVDADSRLWMTLRPTGPLLKEAARAVVQLRTTTPASVKAANQRRARADSLDAVVALPAGVFGLHLQQEGIVDHAVVADTRPTCSTLRIWRMRRPGRDEVACARHPRNCPVLRTCKSLVSIGTRNKMMA